MIFFCHSDCQKRIGRNTTRLKDKFDGHFVIRRNTIYERAKFNQRKQLPGESIDDFITALYGLVEHCEYGKLSEMMIRDYIIVGITDATLAEKLQLNSKLILD